MLDVSPPPIVTMILRDATVSDVTDLTEVAHEAKRHWNYPEAWIAVWSPELSFAPESLTTMHVVVAEEHGRVEGFCALTPGTGRWQLEHLWIRPIAMGRGVGRMLFDDAVAYARSQRATVLAIESDPHAEGFYLRMGATRVGASAAPVEGDPNRLLPVLEIALGECYPVPPKQAG